MVVNSKMG